MLHELCTLSQQVRVAASRQHTTDNKTKNAKGDWIDAPTTVIDYAKAYPVLTNAEVASLRPDLASMAGFTAFTPQQAQSGFGSDPTGEIDDALPF